MAEKINTIDCYISDDVGTWAYAKQILSKIENDESIEEWKRLSNTATNVYKIMVWVEKENHIQNHKIEKNIKIKIPNEYNDYIIICGTMAKLAEKGIYTKEDYEINYDDCLVFQHKHLPGKDKKDKTKIAEDILSNDLDCEEIVKKNPVLGSVFDELFYYRNLQHNEAEKLHRIGYTTKDSEYIKTLQERIDKVLESIVVNSKEDMEFLMKMCSIKDWEELALKMYKRFCSNNSSDYEDDFMNQLFINHKKTQTCINGFTNRFKDYLKNSYYDIINFDFEKFNNSIYGDFTEEGELGVSRPILTNPLKGPEICFHDTQGFCVVAKNVKIKNGVFHCLLSFDFYDHFGLDSNDIKIFGDKPIVGSGFKGWYILQHLNEYKTGCKAYVDHMYHDEIVEIDIE